MPIINGTAGRDTLSGGAGDDSILGGDGDDNLVDDTGGNDSLIGGAGDDYLSIQHGTDASSVLLDGGDGDDTIFAIGGSSNGGPPFTVSILGGAGKDFIEVFGGGLSGSIDAGPGNDSVQVSAIHAGLSLTLGAGDDRLFLEANVYGDLGLPLVVTDFQAGDAGDVLTLVGLSSRLTGWDQSNPFSGGYLRLIQSGSTTILQIDENGGGDSFRDLIDFENTTVDQFTAKNMSDYDPSGAPPPGKVINGSTVFGNENLTGTIGADTINGNWLNDVIHAGAGNDLIDGGTGDDTIFGEAGNDTVTGGTGNDTITGGASDILRGQDGNDALSTDTVFDAQANITLDGGAGADTLTFYTLIGAQTGQGFGGDGADVIQIIGAGGSVTVDAGSGADTVSMTGAGTNTTLTLGSGSDVVRFENFSGLPQATVTDFSPGSGGDRLQLSDYLQYANPDWDPSTNPFDGGFIKLVSSGASTIVQIKVGGALHDALVLQGVPLASLQGANFEGYPPGGGPPEGFALEGTSGADTLTGGVGGDVLTGLDGADRLNGGLGADTLDGGAGDDTLDGGSGVNVVYGGDGNDLISLLQVGGGQYFGDGGDDRIFIGGGTAAGGSFLIDGGDGQDQLTFDGAFPATQSVTMLGGAGDDELSVFSAVEGVIDAGAGNDQVVVSGALGHVEVALGAGADLLRIQGFFAPFGTVTVTDFTAGDRLDFNLFENATSAGEVHPSFLTGTLRLAQLGSDAVFQFNPDGQGITWATIVNLQGVSAASLDSGAIGESTFVRWTLGGDGADTITASTTFECADGDGGADSLTGDAQVNRLAGGAGDDTITAGAGNDSLDGGSGIDQANYLGAHSAFSIHTAKVGGVFVTTVTDTTAGEGTDAVRNVETYSFAGSSFGFAGIQQNREQNLDGGRFDDVLFQRTSTGTVYYQDMTGNAVPGGFQNVLGGLPAGWKAVGSADMNGDGRADTLIQDTSTGSLYYIDQSGGGSAWRVITNQITSAWQFMGAGDVNGDGSVDVVIRDSTTGTVLYRDFAHFSWGSVLGAGTGWNTVGVGDFNHDGYSDVAIQNASDGTVYYANMAGGTFSGWGLITGAVGTDWKVVGTGDINGDGYADVVFQNQSSGLTYFVDMTGGSFNHWGVVAGLAGWTVRDVADLNNDGYADVVIQNNADGTVYYANMAGGVFSGWGLVAGALGTDWVVV